MAWDEALFLSSASQPDGIPVLRFYSWFPSTLSLGRFQNPESGLRHDRPKLPLVRRSTGGGAIWHADEITYSLACHQTHLKTNTVKASFERLCGFLVETWKSLGWQTSFAKDVVNKEVLGQVTAACFAGKEEYDILVNGKKLGGNAQRRQGGAIFQHGSIPMSLEWPLLETLFESEACPKRDQVTDLRTLGWNQNKASLEKLLAENFARCLEVDLVAWEPGDTENRLFEQTLKVYSDPEWTRSGRGSVRDRIHMASP